MIALCVALRKVVVARKPGPGDRLISQSFGFDENIKTDVVADGKEVSSKSASGAPGGLLFGTAGAVVGSNTGKTTYS